MGDIEFGTCKVCKQEKPLQRKYYRYNIDCDCCNNEHFEYVAHCKDCTPVEPAVTKVHIRTEILKKLSTDELPMAIRVLSDNLVTDEAYRESWIANIAMAYKDAEAQYRQKHKLITFLNKEHRHKIANQAAYNFINQIIK